MKAVGSMKSAGALGEKSPAIYVKNDEIEYPRQGSNLQPSASEANALSN